MKIAAFDKNQLEAVANAINPSYTINEKRFSASIVVYELVFCITSSHTLRSRLLAELAKHSWSYLKVEL
jgi:hypothetical protein